MEKNQIKNDPNQPKRIEAIVVKISSSWAHGKRSTRGQWRELNKYLDRQPQSSPSDRDDIQQRQRHCSPRQSAATLVDSPRNCGDSVRRPLRQTLSCWKAPPPAPVHCSSSYFAAPPAAVLAAVLAELLQNRSPFRRSSRPESLWCRRWPRSTRTELLRVARKNAVRKCVSTISFQPACALGQTPEEEYPS